MVTFLAWALGVLLPALTLLIELNSRMCAEEFFDPLPTWMHVFLVACVPLANGFGLVATLEGSPRWMRAALVANGAVLGISAVYTAIFLPLLPLSVIAILIVGMGLLPLAPLFSLITALIIRGRLKRALPAEAPLPRAWIGAAVALVAFFAAEGRVAGTRLALHAAVNGGPKTQRAALEWLREAGSEEILRAACYVAPQRASLLDFLMSFDGAVSTAEARTAYYRVTGQPFNTRPKPDGLSTGRFFHLADEDGPPDPARVDWELATSTVGGRVPGLSLASSELKGSVDGDAALAYLEWTMSFATTAEGQSEARTQVLLPPGAVVSRVTLFIDGQEREAAFASTGKVEAAYAKIVRARRDPLLVTLRGPDRLQVQCFPVVKATPMKIKIGFTVPLLPRDEARFATLLLPSFAERNFHIPEDFRHVVRVESRRPLTTAAGGSVEQRHDGVSEWLGSLADEALQPPKAMLTVERKGAAEVAWTEDLMDAQGYIVRQQLRRSTVELPARVILVVEGSKAMKEALPEIASALSVFPKGTELAVLASRDGVEEILPLGPVSDEGLQRAAKELQGLRAAGGQDGSPALARAWELAAGSERSTVIWVHGPHPLEPGAVGDAPNWWITSRHPHEVLDVMVGRGPNRIAVDLSRAVRFRPVPRLGTLEEDLRRVFTSWGGHSYVLQRDRLPVTEVSSTGEAWKTSSHLARLWASSESDRLLAEGGDESREQAGALAARHQLVTEVSGAVVLERKEQYDEAGLRPVEPGTVPSVPEPETWMLLAVACALLGAFAFRLRRAP
ncbi:PEP-CTERM sorting domain-containing protein [Hyalangium minutum]|uniref:PEP-CTERM sorting domain-containing protein n=1 Tax=Hyalangium minutum TaxID=394096 RepID=UPI001F0B0B19|nr:PEP-CTERM sorting domain-containing protein [Hyalangium minutum]